MISIENINGGSGNDKITGNKGKNTLNGEKGNDRLYGAGNDLLIGGVGKTKSGDRWTYLRIQRGTGYTITKMPQRTGQDSWFSCRGLKLKTRGDDVHVYLKRPYRLWTMLLVIFNVVETTSSDN